MVMICIPTGIFMVMAKKTKHLRVRLTESQARRLVSLIILEQRSKSQVIRDALNRYLVEDHKFNEENDNDD
jgi:hypothetical protein